MSVDQYNQLDTLERTYTLKTSNTVSSQINNESAVESEEEITDEPENIIWNIKMKYPEVSKIHLLIIFGLSGIP